MLTYADVCRRMHTPQDARNVNTASDMDDLEVHNLLALLVQKALNLLALLVDKLKRGQALEAGRAGAQFTCFTSTKKKYKY